MRSRLFRYAVAVVVFFAIPQILAECAWKGTVWHVVLIRCSAAPIFAAATALDDDPLRFWALDVASAAIWFSFLAWGWPKAMRFFRHGKPALVGLAVLCAVGFATVRAAVEPSPPGTIESVVLSRLQPGMAFEEARLLVPRKWFAGMYGGESVTPEVVRQTDRLAGTFRPAKQWDAAKRELSLRRFDPVGIQEYSYLYFDGEGKLLFWFHYPD